MSRVVTLTRQLGTPWRWTVTDTDFADQAFTGFDWASAWMTARSAQSQGAEVVWAMAEEAVA